VTEFAKTVKEAVGGNVRTYRQLRGLDQEALARRLNVGLAIPWRRVTVSEVERGERHVTVTELLWLALALETTIEQLLDTRGPERLQGPWLVPLSADRPLPAETIAELGRETRGRDGDNEIVGREIRFQAIPPENLTALVCRHKARAVAEWDDETGTLKALRYEQVEQS
jgi:transcriptional regulator with XRE-family HTH domain